MSRLSRSAIAASLLGLALVAPLAAPVSAATCGNNSSGFGAWKSAFASEAAAQGIGSRALDALGGASYSRATISADRGQKSFRLSLDQFMAKRGASAIVSQGRRLKRSNAALFAAIEERYGVPAGPLIAIWGMETGFGRVMGNQNLVSAVATLAYDCRRSEFFTDQLLATLTLIDRGALTPGERSSMHGEIGQTQFLPKNVLSYGVGNLDTPSGALQSTANFLHAHGWRGGAGYQPGEPNFAAIEAWNAASVYQRAIALMGQRIDAGDGS
jgi:membrane-bound lytic murein transglycosylase B